jgi:hypothetical protein
MVMFGDADVMVAGGTESSIDPLSMAGFCRWLPIFCYIFKSKGKVSHASAFSVVARHFLEDVNFFDFGSVSLLLLLAEPEH